MSNTLPHRVFDTELSWEMKPLAGEWVMMEMEPDLCNVLQDHWFSARTQHLPIWYKICLSAPSRLNWISGQHICHPHRASATQKGDFGFGSVVMEKEEQGHEKFKLWVIYAFMIYLFRYFRAVQPIIPLVLITFALEI